MSKQAKEVHIVIRNGLVESVYSDENVDVYVYDLNIGNWEYQKAMENKVKRLDDKYINQGCTYTNEQDL